MAREVVQRGITTRNQLIIVFSQVRDRIFETLTRNTSCLSRAPCAVSTFLRQNRPTARLALSHRNSFEFFARFKKVFKRNSVGITSLYLLGLFAFAEEKMGDEISESIKKADDLYENGKLEECYQVLLKLKDSGNAEALWKLARACRRLSQLLGQDAKALTYAGLEFAQKALEADSNNFQCHKWTGVMLSEVGDFEGSKQKIKNAFIIKEHFEKAIELSPTDPTCRHLMGRWCYSSADLSWFLRKFAETLFGSPPKSTYEEALQHFEKAEELSPGFYSANLLMIAKCYVSMNKRESARPWLKKLSDFDSATEDDRKAKEEGSTLL